MNNNNILRQIKKQIFLSSGSASPKELYAQFAKEMKKIPTSQKLDDDTELKLKALSIAMDTIWHTCLAEAVSE